MGWYGGHQPRFDIAPVPSLPLRLSCPVAVELTGRDAGGSGGICPTPRFCLPVACCIYCPGTHDYPGEGVDHVDHILGEAVEDRASAQV